MANLGSIPRGCTLFIALRCGTFFRNLIFRPLVECRVKNRVVRDRLPRWSWIE